MFYVVFYNYNFLNVGRNIIYGWSHDRDPASFNGKVFATSVITPNILQEQQATSSNKQLFSINYNLWKKAYEWKKSRKFY